MAAAFAYIRLCVSGIQISAGRTFIPIATDELVFYPGLRTFPIYSAKTKLCEILTPSAEIDKIFSCVNIIEIFGYIAGPIVVVAKRLFNP